MGTNLKRIYKNCVNGGFCDEDELKSLGNMDIFHKTKYVYDTQTRFVYCMPDDSSKPVPRVSRGRKHYRFDGNRMVV